MQVATVTDIRAKWLESRSSFLGGSDASAILGMNPYKSNVEVWEEKQAELSRRI